MKLNLVLTTVCSFALLAACSSDKKKAPEETKPAAAEQTTATPEAAPAADEKKEADAEPMDAEEVQDELVGIWRVKLSALADSPEIKALDESQRQRALETAQQMVGNLAFEFTPDGKMNLYMGDKVRNGTYEVLKAKGDVISLKTTHGSGAEVETEEVEVVLGDGTLKVTGQDKNQTLVLERGAPGLKDGAGRNVAGPNPAAAGGPVPAVAPQGK